MLDEIAMILSTEKKIVSGTSVPCKLVELKLCPVAGDPERPQLRSSSIPN
jgi:hypothetical protein